MPRGRRRRSWPWRYRRALFLVALMLVTGLAGVAFVLAQVPLPPQSLQPESTFVLDADGEQLAVLHAGENRTLVGLADVPRTVIEAVVAAEDRDYFRHSGVDPLAILRATVADLRAGGVEQGGSTITQQYVKNTYLGSERTLWRKLREAVLAVKLERKLSKEEILERYLNSIYLGRGAYGVQAAARAWFGQDIGELGLKEAAYLAGLIRAPESADASRDATAAERRRASVLDAMAEEGYIADADREAVSAIAVTDYVVPRGPAGSRVSGSAWGTEHFVEAVRQELVTLFPEATVLGGGLRVETTLDMDLQRLAHNAAYGLLDSPDDPSVALVTLDQTGAVKAMVGGRDWESSKVNLALGAAGGGGGRQAGSAFKPFVLAELVRQGFSVRSTLASPARIILPGADDGEDWTVANYGRTGHGRLSVERATQVSSNTAYAQLVMLVGPERVAELATEMGVTAELAGVPSITLGTQAVSPLDMAAGFSTLANRGVRSEPHLITQVSTADGQVLFTRRPSQQRVLEASVADVVTSILRRVVTSGTGRAADPGFPVAGKTGTTQSYGDAWFVGYTPSHSVAVWVGYPEGQARSMEHVRGRAVTGGSFPAEVFARFMGDAGLDGGPFRDVDTGGGEPITRTVRYVNPDATTSTAPPPSSSSTTAPAVPSTTTPVEPPPTSAPTTTTVAPEPPATTVATSTTAPPEA